MPTAQECVQCCDAALHSAAAPSCLVCYSLSCCIRVLLATVLSRVDVRPQLAWVCYDHPNMPWDDTELWVADVGEAGELSSQRKVH